MPLRPHQLGGDEVHHALAPARALNAQHLAPLVDDVVNGLPLAVSEIRLRIRHRHAQQCLRLCLTSHKFFAFSLFIQLSPLLFGRPMGGVGESPGTKPISSKHRTHRYC